MMRKWIKSIIGALALTVFMGVSVSAAEVDFPASDQKGDITIHSFDVSSYENLKGSTGAEVDENNLPDDAKKLSDVIFTIQRLDDSDGKPVSATTPIDYSFPAQKGKTDSNGELTFSDLPKGYYLVTEEIPTGYSAQKPTFIVMLPLKTMDRVGNVSWNYDVHVYPKNMQKGQIEKQAVGRKVVGVGDEVLWDVDYEVGRDIKEDTENGRVYAKDFYITDTMDSRLTYVDGSAVFQLYDRTDKLVDIKLIAGVDYIEVYDKNTNTVTWNYTDAGVRVLADNEIGKTKVSIRTLVNPTALGTVDVIWNNASIDFVNASGDPYHLDVFPPNSDKNGADVPKVYLGSIKIDKHEKGEKEKKLSNVTFKIASTQENAKSGKFIQVEDGKDYERTTDERGYAIFTALGSGDYWLVETKTAEGYQLLESPIKVTIGEKVDESSVLVSIENEKTDDGKEGGGGGKVPPKTGDETNLFYPIAIMGISVLVVIVLWKKRRRNSDETGEKHDN